MTQDTSNNQNSYSRPSSNGVVAFLNNEKVRAVIYQVLAVGLVVLGAWYLISNTFENLARQNIATGFDYLNYEASFEIGESMIDFSAEDSYGWALIVGLLNTVKVSAIGILLATTIGTVVGIARLSSNWIVRNMAMAYVDLFRNIPVLLQLFFWYALINNSFPGVRQALNPMPGVFLSNRGFYIPVPESHPVFLWMLGALVVGIVAALFVRKWAVARQDETGEHFPYVWAGIGVALLFPAVTYFIGGAPTEMSIPALKGFNFRGGAVLSPEFAAILIGLTIYTSTYIAEVVRSGILAVPKGQWEAAESVGMKRSDTLRLIILPQSMRVVIPPLTNQFLNLTKNSSLAVAVGYPDLVSISGTTMNQTGQAIEAIAIFMSIYLGLSLFTSVFMNWFNAKMAVVER